MAGWRAIDQEPVASRQAIGAGLTAALDAIAALAGDGERPVITACWQDEAYIDVPPGLLARLGTLGQLAVACTGHPRLADGTQHVLLDADELTLAAEWSIVALTSRGGVALVAHEVDASLPAGTVENGRAFRYDATADPRIVVAHARRLARTFGARMTPETAATVAETITALASTADADESPPPALERWAGHIARIIDVADTARRDRTLEHSDQGGLAALAGWLADAGPRAPALGMIVVRAGVRGATSVLREHAASVGRLGDLIVDVPPDAAMLVLPGLEGAALERRADEVCALVSEQLATGDVRACAVEVPAVQARRDLVGSLGQALAQLREPTPRQVA